MTTRRALPRTARKAKMLKVPKEPLAAFAYLTSCCANGAAKELIKAGRSSTESQNLIIASLLAFASGAACRLARAEGRVPNKTKWRRATSAAFDAAVRRTAPKDKP